MQVFFVTEDQNLLECVISPLRIEESPDFWSRRGKNGTVEFLRAQVVSRVWVCGNILW